MHVVVLIYGDTRYDLENRGLEFEGRSPEPKTAAEVVAMETGLDAASTGVL